MKNLIKFAIVGMLLVFSISIYSQDFGVRAGLNLSNMLFKDKDETYSDKFEILPGFQAGFMVDVPIAGVFSVEPGIFLSTKGFRWKESETVSGSTFSMDASSTPLYLDIQVPAKVTFPAGDLEIFVYAGPYMGIGMGGKNKMEMTWDGESHSEDNQINWGSKDDDDYRAIDFGGITGVGVQYRQFQWVATYELGLANISSFQENETTIKNRVLGVAFGYRFSKN